MKAHSEISKGLTRWALQMISALVIFGAILFFAAGRMTWPAGWIYLGMNALTQLLSAFILIPRQSGMLADRSGVHAGTQGYDRILAPAVAVTGTLAVIITAGLDARFSWSAPFPSSWWIGGLGLAFTSQVFVLWAMASNPFFSTTVRIQAERGHQVVQSGPYRLVRHPGYAGSLVYNLALPLVLASWWTFIPALLTILLLIIRSDLEDRTLKAALPGYTAYAQTVQQRLIPGLW